MSGDTPLTEADTRACCKTCGRDLSASASHGQCAACVRQALFEKTITEEGPPQFIAPTVAQLNEWLPACEVLEIAGAGGMGYVYKARQVALDRVVAIKVLPVPGAATTSGHFLAEQFLLEARAMARLSHPNIVAIHDFGSAGDGYFYFIMEFIEGVALDEFVRITQPTVAEALRLILPICEALAYAHGEGIVHRDIKPANILVGSRQQVKVADFGIAKLAGVEREAPVLGTPGFMAPEQRQAGGFVDGRADLYSLGVLIHLLMTGERPAARRRKIAELGGVSVRLDAVLDRALRENPAERYPSAEEMKADLEDVIRHQELMTGQSRTPWMAPRRNGSFLGLWLGRLAWLAVLGLFAAAAYFGFQKWGHREAAAKPPLAAGATFRKFANRAGKAFEGEALSHFGRVVRVRDREGKVWSLPLETLSDEDQAWVREWRHGRKPELGEGDVTLEARRPPGAALQRVRDLRFEIVVGNTTDEPVPGLEVEYRVFFESDGLKRAGERLPVGPLKPGGSKVLATTALERPALPPRGKGESPPPKPKVLGLWAKVHHAGHVVAEHRDAALQDVDWNAGSPP